jgi:hypothetical protein
MTSPSEIRRATVNANARGVWAMREGTELEYVGPGANAFHCRVRYPGKKPFCLPTRWLDFEEGTDV